MYILQPKIEGMEFIIFFQHNHRRSKITSSSCCMKKSCFADAYLSYSGTNLFLVGPAELLHSNVPENNLNDGINLVQFQSSLMFKNS